MAKIDKQILQALNDFGPLTLDEIALELNQKPKAVFKALRRLFAKEEIISKPMTRRYAIAKEEFKE